MNLPSSEKKCKSSVYLNKTWRTRKIYPTSKTVLFTGQYVLFEEYQYLVKDKKKKQNNLWIQANKYYCSSVLEHWCLTSYSLSIIIIFFFL